MKMQNRRTTRIGLIMQARNPMALTLLIVSFTVIALSSSANQIEATYHQLTSSNRALWPPVYVVQDKPQRSSHQQKSWNNRKLTVLLNGSPHSQQVRASGAGASKQAKQLASSEEPFPYYLLYKQAGFGSGEGAHADQYYQPLRRSQFNSEVQWYSREPKQSGTKTAARKQDGDSNAGRYASGAKRSGGGSKGVSSRRRVSVQGKSNKSPAHVSQTSREPPVLAGAGPFVTASNSTRARRPTSASNKKKLVCYYGAWAAYRPDAGKYPVENIDPFLCTHIIYGFTGLSYDYLIKPLDPWNDLEDNHGKGAMKRFTNLKRINPNLKTLVAIGGWNEGSIKYSRMASEPESRAKFVKSVVEFLAKYNFDGLDLDWEYPGARGGHSYDKQNFVRLLRELKESFEPHGYLLTAAVSAGKWFIDSAYDIPQVSKYLDLINLMAYDYHGGWETRTGMNAPLFHSPKHDSRDDMSLNVNWSINYWLQKGALPEQIMLGVGSYGRSFTLDKANINGINAPASQKGQAGPYTRESGSLGYNEICESFKQNPQAWTIVRDPDYLAPYAYNDRQWVGYDDMESLTLKAQYAKSLGLGGVMMWSLETDDFLGHCHDEKYPLLNTIKRVLNGAGPVTKLEPSSGTGPSTTRRPTPSTTPDLEVEDEVPTKPQGTSSTRRPLPLSTSRRPRPSRPTASTTATTTTTSTPTTTTTTTTRRPQGSTNDEFVCRADGMFADPKNCRKFIRCVSFGGSSNFSLYRFDCGPGTAFNKQFQYCDHIYNVPHCKQSSNSDQNLDDDEEEHYLIRKRQQQRLYNRSKQHQYSGE